MYTHPHTNTHLHTHTSLQTCIACKYHHHTNARKHTCTQAEDQKERQQDEKKDGILREVKAWAGGKDVRAMLNHIHGYQPNHPSFLARQTGRFSYCVSVNSCICECVCRCVDVCIAVLIAVILLAPSCFYLHQQYCCCTYNM